MALIIDAYNVLHCTHVLPARYAMISATDLCRLLEHSRWAGRPIHVVCDGTRKPTEDDYEGPVELIYAGDHPGAGRDADSVIEAIIESSDAPRDLTVVSNDRRLQKAGRRRRARTLTSERFLQLLIKSPAPPRREPDKPRAIGNTDEWLDAFEIDQQTVEQIEEQIEAQEVEAPAEVDLPATDQGSDAKTRHDSSSPPPPPAKHKPDTDTDYWLRQFGFAKDESENDLQ